VVISGIAIITGITGLCLGIILGSLLGRTGSVQLLACLLRVPLILITAPEKLKSKWKIWRELRDARKIRRLNRQKKIKDLKEQIARHKQGIKNIKSQIRRVQWEFSEPKNTSP